MNKKGFTLVELIGVVVILGLIALIAFPSLLNQINNSKKQISDSQKELIIAATKNYVEENKNEYANKNSFEIDADTLVNNNYLNKEILESYKNKKKVKVIIVYKNNDYDVVIKNG